jgi:acetyl esterase/lipase
MRHAANGHWRWWSTAVPAAWGARDARAPARGRVTGEAGPRSRLPQFLLPALAATILLAAVLPGPAPAETTYQTIRDVVYRERDGERLLADVYEPADTGLHAAVLLLHGGAWTAGNKDQLDFVARFLAVHGYTVVAINYRLAPQHKFPAQLEDCRDALGWIRQHAAEYRIDPARLAVWGYSAGGHLAALLGVTTPGLAAVVAGGAPCDFRPMPPDNPYLAFWLGDTRRNKPEVYRDASPVEFASADDPPIFFYHGKEDALVPFDQPKTMVGELNKRGASAELYAVEHAGHLRCFVDRSAIEAGKKFLDRRLGAAHESPRQSGGTP